MTPSEVLQRWFAAHASGDQDAARAVMAADATLSVPGRRVVGFDAFMAWYRERQDNGPSFTYLVDDVLSGDRHAAALLSLRSADAEWRQLVLYEVRDDVIVSVWAVEDGP